MVQVETSTRAPRPARENARRVVGDAAAGDVGRAFQHARVNERADRFQIAAMHLQQFVGQALGPAGTPATSNSSLRASE